MMIKKFYTLLILITLGFCYQESKAQLPYIKPCYGINAGNDTAVCSNVCTNATRVAIPQYDNRATNTYLVQQMNMPTPAYNTTGNNVIVDLDDIWSSIVNIGFNFCFFGATYNKIVIGANGLVSFNTAYANAYCQWSYTGGIPDVAKPINSIMGPYMDIDPSIGFNANRINYYTEGTAPCRRFVINFFQVPLFSSSCSTLKLTSQIILHEAYNIIDIAITNKPACTSWNSGNTIIGIQNAAGTSAFNAPGYNPGTASFTNKCWRFLPNGALQQSINWTLNGNVVSNTATLNESVCPTSNNNFIANLVNDRCDGSTVVVSDNFNFAVNQKPTADAGPDKVIGCASPSVQIGTPAVAGHTYTWSPNSNLNNAGIAQPLATANGTYTLTVRNTATGCTATDAVTVTSNNTPPVANAGPDKVLSCSGTTIGTAGVAGNSYSWSPSTGLNDPNIAQPNVTLANTYTLTVTNIANGCITTDAVIVTGSILLPTADAGPDKEITCTNPTRQIGTAAVAGNTYSWSPTTGLSDPLIAQPIASLPNTYTLTVTKTSNGCFTTDAVLVTRDIVAPTANAGTDKILTCTSTTQQIGTPAIAGHTYSWSPATGLSNALIAQPLASQAGNYTLTVTNTANGCIDTDIVVVTENKTPPIANAGADKVLTCAVTSQQIGTAAIAGNTYAWSPSTNLSNDAIAQPIASAVGNYTLTVTNNTNGCTATDVVSITQNITPPLANAGANKILTCANPTQQIGTAAIAGNTYAWSPAAGLSSSSIAQPNASNIGTYTLTVTNTANGCTATDLVTVTENRTAPSANAGIDKEITCAINSVLIGTPATAGNTYSWSPITGLSDPLIAQPTTNTNGNYTLTVTNTVNGCKATDVVSVTKNTTAPTANAGNNKVLTCTNTTQQIGSPAIAGNTYAWSPAIGLSNDLIAQPIASQANTYTLTVTNTANGCTATDVVSVTQNITPPIADAGANKILTCANPTQQIGTPTIAGNTYAWSPTFGLSSNSIAQPTANAIGNYTLTVTNNVNGCTASDVVGVTQDISTPIANAGADKLLTCAVTSQQIGSTPIAGNTYSWSPTLGLSDADIAQPLSTNPGNYTLTVTKNSNGCKATDVVTVTQNITPPTADAGANKVLTCAITTQQIGSPAIAGNTYAWSPNIGLSNYGIAEPIANAIGNYTVTVTNTANGCKATDVVNVSQNISSPIANAGADKVLTCAITSQQIGTAAISGNTYAWSPSANLSNDAIAQPTASAPGNYTVTVTNNTNGCSSTDVVAITQNTTPPTANAGSNVLLTCTNPLLQIGTAAIAGNTYTWSPAIGLSSTSSAQTMVNKAGTYTVTVKDNSNGCTASDQLVINIDTIKPFADAGISKTLTCNQTAHTIGSSAIAGHTYSWSPGVGLNNANIAQPIASSMNTYTVTVTRLSNGCIAKDSVFINQNITTSMAAAGDDLSITCTKQSHVIGTPATPNSTYSWSPAIGLNNPNIAQPTVNKPGTYSLTVTNTITGCISNDVVNIPIDTLPPNANAGSDKTLNCLEKKVSIGNAGLNGMSYTWSSNGVVFANTAQPQVSNTGTYVMTITKNASGCKNTDSMQVFIDTIKPIADAGVDQTFDCPNIPLVLGVAPQSNTTYQWFGKRISDVLAAQPTTDTSGVFSLIVTNATNHCKSKPDTVLIFPRNCDCLFFIPTAFSPNNDGYNDILQPLKYCDDYSDLIFSVFNRWGELVFKSTSIDIGWNGEFKNESQLVDNYIWTLEYYDVLNQTNRFTKGVTTLLK